MTGDVVSVAISVGGKGAKLGFKPAGGGDLGLNVFCQPNFPLTYNGVLQKGAGRVNRWRPMLKWPGGQVARPTVL